MNHAVEEYVGQLMELKQKQALIDSNRSKIEQWITWLDSETRFGVVSEWEKRNKKELQHLLESIL
jgi:hypothetical protein